MRGVFTSVLVLAVLFYLNEIRPGVTIASAAPSWYRKELLRSLAVSDGEKAFFNARKFPFTFSRKKRNTDSKDDCSSIIESGHLSEGFSSSSSSLSEASASSSSLVGVHENVKSLINKEDVVGKKPKKSFKKIIKSVLKKTKKIVRPKKSLAKIDENPLDDSIQISDGCYDLIPAVDECEFTIGSVPTSDGSDVNEAGSLRSQFDFSDDGSLSGATSNGDNEEERPKGIFRRVIRFVFGIAKWAWRLNPFVRSNVVLNDEKSEEIYTRRGNSVQDSSAMHASTNARLFVIPDGGRSEVEMVKIVSRDSPNTNPSDSVEDSSAMIDSNNVRPFNIPDEVRSEVEMEEIVCHDFPNTNPSDLFQEAFCNHESNYGVEKFLEKTMTGFEMIENKGWSSNDLTQDHAHRSITFSLQTPALLRPIFPRVETTNHYRAHRDGLSIVMNSESRTQVTGDKVTMLSQWIFEPSPVDPSATRVRILTGNVSKPRFFLKGKIISESTRMTKLTSEDWVKLASSHIPA